MKARTVIMVAVTLAVFAIAAAAGNETRYEARLTGWGKGKATYKVKREDRFVQSELQVEGENLAPNTNYIVFVGKDNVWQTRTNAFGAFAVREASRNGSGLPVTAGTVVNVNDTTGNTVLTGAFVQVAR